MRFCEFSKDSDSEMWNVPSAEFSCIIDFFRYRIASESWKLAAFTSLHWHNVYFPLMNWIQIPLMVTNLGINICGYKSPAKKKRAIGTLKTKSIIAYSSWKINIVSTLHIKIMKNPVSTLHIKIMKNPPSIKGYIYVYQVLKKVVDSPFSRRENMNASIASANRTHVTSRIGILAL